MGFGRNETATWEGLTWMIRGHPNPGTLSLGLYSRGVYQGKVKQTPGTFPRYPKIPKYERISEPYTGGDSGPTGMFLSGSRLEFPEEV